MAKIGYFSIVPNIRVGYPGSKNTWDQEYVITKNIFRRVVTDFSKIKGLLSFESYVIPGSDKPYQVSQRIYNTPEYEWVILITNNITNVYKQWPKSDDEFFIYFRKKYGTQLEGIHHYATREIKFDDITILQEGLIVDQSYTHLRPDGIVLTGNQVIKPVSNYEYEWEQNEEKRKIYLLDPSVIEIFVTEVEKKLQYQFSGDTINDTTKDTGDDDAMFYRVNVFDTESGDPQLE
jgi:hypothetical protein